MASNSAIWWVKASAANGTESTATSDTTNFSDGEVILFNESPVVAKGGLIFQSEFNFRQSIAENKKVDGTGNEIQDMGIGGVEVQITGLIKDSDVTNTPVTKFMTWSNELKTGTGFTQGRFGLRIDDFPYFNLVPTSTYGYVLNDLTFARNPDKDNKVGFILTLRVGGDIRGWLDANSFNGE